MLCRVRVDLSRRRTTPPPRFWFVPEFAFPWDARNATSLSPLHFPFLQVLLDTTCFVYAPGMTAATCCHYACPSPRGCRHAHFIFAGVFVLGPSLGVDIP